MEQKTKRIQGEDYVPLPEAKDVAGCIIQTVELNQVRVFLLQSQWCCKNLQTEPIKMVY